MRGRGRIETLGKQKAWSQGHDARLQADEAGRIAQEGASENGDCLLEFEPAEDMAEVSVRSSIEDKERYICRMLNSIHLLVILPI